MNTKRGKGVMKTNVFYEGDNLNILKKIPDESIDLIYLDPPFYNTGIQKGEAKWKPGEMELTYNDTKRYWGDNEKSREMRKNAPRWITDLSLKEYEKHKSLASYLFYMMERLQECYNVLKPTGSIYLHCDYRASHYLKMIMDEIFGLENFRNDISWRRESPKGAKVNSKQFPRDTDNILIYVKSKNYLYHNQWIEIEYSETEARKKGYRFDNKEKKFFKTSPRGDYTDDSIKRLNEENRILKTKNGNIRVKYWLDTINGKVIEKKLVDDIWTDIPGLMHVSPSERLGYPTQKPEALLERIIKASSNKGDIVLDPFCGCGTTIAVAEKLSRKWIGIDINKESLDAIRERFTKDGLTFNSEVQKDYEKELNKVMKMSGNVFEVWVNGQFKAIKVSPDRGVDGITPEGIAIQSKTTHPRTPRKDVSQFLTDVKYHPNKNNKIHKPIKKMIFVSQNGYDDACRRLAYKIEKEEGVKIELLEPEDVIKMNKEK